MKINYFSKISVSLLSALLFAMKKIPKEEIISAFEFFTRTLPKLAADEIHFGTNKVLRDAKSPSANISKDAQKYSITFQHCYSHC